MSSDMARNGHGCGHAKRDRAITVTEELLDPNHCRDIGRQEQLVACVGCDKRRSAGARLR